jgi:predicted DNA-binding transcriptional regulator AlpA
VKLAAVTSLDQLNMILTLPEIAAIYRLSHSTVRQKLQDGTFHPRPFASYPYRWRKSAVEADLERDRPEHEKKNHGGFLTRTRPRPVKADLRKKATRPRKNGTR